MIKNCNYSWQYQKLFLDLSGINFAQKCIFRYTIAVKLQINRKD